MLATARPIPKPTDGHCHPKPPPASTVPDGKDGKDGKGGKGGRHSTSATGTDATTTKIGTGSADRHIDHDSAWAPVPKLEVQGVAGF